MPARALLLIGLLLLGGCAVGERPTLSEEGIADGRPADAEGGLEAATAAAALGAPIPDDEPATSLPDPATLIDVPPALLSPTGVLVPALGRSDGGGYRVLSPCGNEVDLRWGQPVWEATVVLDPGHGGDEAGAIGPSGETEAEVNLDIAWRTASLLEQRGWPAVLTRTSDYRIPIANRAAIADQFRASAFVSIHHNSPSPSLGTTPGTEVYVQNDSTDARRLGSLLHEEVVAALAPFDAEWAARADAGVLTVLNADGDDAFGINRYPTVPSALAELAYLSNPTEAVLISTDEYREAMAGALSSAIVRYLDTADEGSGFVAEPRLFDPAGDTGGSEGCVDPALS
ncbi:MAG: N-acetylmuramoyl-L-alanine amidase [Acidimicrobiales bacterium]